jgi:hypothetical protein
MEHLDTTQEKHKHYERDRQRKVSKRLDLMLDFLQKVSKRLNLMSDFLQNSYRLSLESAEPIHKIIDHFLKPQKIELSLESAELTHKEFIKSLGQQRNVCTIISASVNST